MRSHNYKVYIASAKKVYDVSEMVFVNPIDVYINEPLIGWRTIDNTSAILLQGTGKLDVKGNEIFEGMTFEGKSEHEWVVKYDADHTIFICQNDSGQEMPLYHFEGCPITGWSFEVI